MSKTVFTIEARPPFRDTKGRWTKSSDKMLASARSGMRDQGRRMVSLMQDEAPKRSGQFAKDIRFRSFASSGGTGSIGFTVTTPQPLGTFIIRGTKPHRIAARRAKALFFHWARIGANVVVPKGGGFSTHWRAGNLWIGKGYVNHPGTKPNKFEGRAYRRWIPGARGFMAKLSRDFIKDFTAR